MSFTTLRSTRPKLTLFLHFVWILTKLKRSAFLCVDVSAICHFCRTFVLEIYVDECTSDDETGLEFQFGNEIKHWPRRGVFSLRICNVRTDPEVILLVDTWQM
jgi:hypothetical protein